MVGERYQEEIREINGNLKGVEEGIGKLWMVKGKYI